MRYGFKNIFFHNNLYKYKFYRHYTGLLKINIMHFRLLKETLNEIFQIRNAFSRWNNLLILCSMSTSIYSIERVAQMIFNIVLIIDGFVTVFLHNLKIFKSFLLCSFTVYCVSFYCVTEFWMYEKCSTNFFDALFLTMFSVNVFKYKVEFNVLKLFKKEKYRMCLVCIQ